MIVDLSVVNCLAYSIFKSIGLITCHIIILSANTNANTNTDPNTGISSADITEWCANIHHAHLRDQIAQNNCLLGVRSFKSNVYAYTRTANTLIVSSCMHGQKREKISPLQCHGNQSTMCACAFTFTYSTANYSFVYSICLHPYLSVYARKNGLIS